MSTPEPLLKVTQLPIEEMEAICHAFSYGAADEARKVEYRSYEDTTLKQAYEFGRLSLAKAQALKPKGKRG